MQLEPWHQILLTETETAPPLQVLAKNGLVIRGVRSPGVSFFLNSSELPQAPRTVPVVSPLISNIVPGHVSSVLRNAVNFLNGLNTRVGPRHDKRF